jgi:hypothetical protein
MCQHAGLVVEVLRKPRLGKQCRTFPVDEHGINIGRIARDGSDVVHHAPVDATLAVHNPAPDGGENVSRYPVMGLLEIAIPIPEAEHLLPHIRLRHAGANKAGRKHPMLLQHVVMAGLKERHRIIIRGGALDVLDCHKQSLRPAEEGAEFQIEQLLECWPFRRPFLDEPLHALV